MRRIIIDALDMTDKAALDLVLKEALNLPPYYGNNLDALWDCLMEIKPVELVLRNSSVLDGLPNDLGRKLIALLDQAGTERRDFVFRQSGRSKLRV